MSVLNIVPPPWPVLKFRDLVRKWHHNSDDSTDISFRLILSVLYFSLISISSCAIKPLKNKLFSVTSNPSTLVVFSGRALTVVLQKIIIITNKHILWFNFTVKSLWGFESKYLHSLHSVSVQYNLQIYTAVKQNLLLFT